MVMLEVLHDHSPHYSLFKTQCYWYAGTLWEILREEFDGEVSNNGHQAMAGRYKSLQIIDQPPAASDLIVRYRAAWKDFCNKEAREQQEAARAVEVRICRHSIKSSS
jgi:hypothetical protein